MVRDILVIGAGELGMAILSALSSKVRQEYEHDDPTSTSKQPQPQLQLHVLLRPGSSAVQQIKGSGLPIQVVQGDITAPVEELSKLFHPYDVIISATGFAAGPGSQLHLAKAVIASCPSPSDQKGQSQSPEPKPGTGPRRQKHYFPWQFGVDYDVIGKGSSQPLFDEQLDVRDLLRSQDNLKWTIVSTGLFTSFLFEPMFGVVDLDLGSGKDDDDDKRPGGGGAGTGSSVTALGGWENSLTITSAEDIGKFVAAMVTVSPRPLSNTSSTTGGTRTGDGVGGASGIPEEVIHVAGDTITFQDVFDQVSGVLTFHGRGQDPRHGRGHGLKVEVEKKVLTVSELEDRLAKDPEDLTTKYQLIWARGKGVSWDLDQSWNVRNGLEGEPLAEWVGKYLVKRVQRG